MSINLGLNIAMRALSTYTEAIDVTNHNIANMADPYYSRQVADISATIPMNMLGAAGQLGTGSMVSMIERMRDTFLDSQIQAEESNVGKWEELDRVYQLLSAVIPEVNGATNGLQSKIDAFFADWQALATAAAGGVTANIAAAQAVLISDSTALASSLNEIAADFSDIQLGLTTDLKAKIDSVNSYIQQIYEFNKEIKIAYGMGQIPNDLLDMRNEAITKLSELVNVNVQSKDDGTQIVTIAGKVLVNGGDYFNTLTTVAGNADPRLERVGLYQNGANPVDITDYITGGELAGILQSRDTVVKGYKDKLDEFASSLIMNVNTLHEAGVNSVPFFVGYKAATIMVNSDLVKDPTKINYKILTANDLANVIANLGDKVINNFVASSAAALPANLTATNYVLGPTIVGPPPITGLGIADGYLIINGVQVFFKGTDTIQQLVNNINNNVSNFSIVFNPATRQFYMNANDTISIQEYDTSAGKSLMQTLGWYQETISAAPINSAPAPSVDPIIPSRAWNFNNMLPAPPAPPTVQYVSAFRLNTAASTLGAANGTITVNYNGSAYSFNWNMAGTPNLILGQIQVTTGLATNLDPNAQKITFISNVQGWSALDPPLPAGAVAGFKLESPTFSDKGGNMTQVMNLPGVTRFGDVYKTIVGQLTGQLSSGDNMLSGYKAALAQYQTMQANVTRVDEKAEIAQAKMYQRAYDASVRLLSVIDEMLNMLINRTATPSDTTTTTG